MNGAAPAQHAVADPARVALARSIGMAAALYGYPLLESMRTCRLQTRAQASAEGQPQERPFVNQLLHWAGPTQAENRDVVTPANDLMYSTAWVDLASGPQRLRVPAAAAHPGRYFVLALYDAYTENFCNLGPRNCAAQGEEVWLLGPQTPATQVPEGARVLRCPTHLVWLLGRILVRSEDDLPAAQRLQAEIELPSDLAPGQGPQRPATVAQWRGDLLDPIAALTEHGEHGRAPEEVAAAFYANLCLALQEAPGRVEDAGHVASFAAAGLHPGHGFHLEGLEPALRQGLVAGLVDAAQLLAGQARTRQPRPWVLSYRNGRYGSNYLARAVVAFIGLGALHTEEALYAMAHFDAELQPLHGSHAYTLRFEPGQWPPADAFWSVTLYDADRYLYPNPLRRHALGDRSPGLQADADGGLTLHIGHTAPAMNANWLPAPRGRFYLVLRLYHPQPEVKGWAIPALQRMAT